MPIVTMEGLSRHGHNPGNIMACFQDVSWENWSPAGWQNASRMSQVLRITGTALFPPCLVCNISTNSDHFLEKPFR
jgi:hypothetical protein